MLGLSPSLASGQIRIYLYAKPTDMRRSYDGLTAIVQSEFKMDVRMGDLFLFLNRRRDRIKLMWWDGDGIAIFMKRLERGSFERPALATNGNQVVLDATDLALLLTGVELKTAKRRQRYSLPSTTLEHVAVS